MERVQQVAKYLITLRTTHVCKYRICGIWIYSTTGAKCNRTQEHRYAFQALHWATSTRQTQIDWKQSGGRPCIGKTSTGDIIPYHHGKLKGRCNNCNALFLYLLNHYTAVRAKAKESTPNITPYLVGLFAGAANSTNYYFLWYHIKTINDKNKDTIPYRNHIIINTTITTRNRA